MALAAGQYRSGGRVFDEDGREVVAAVGGSGGALSFMDLADVDEPTFADGEIPVWDATAQKFVGRTPPGEDLHRVTSTAAPTATGVGFAARTVVGIFENFNFTMPDQPVIVEFYCPNVSNNTADRATNFDIEKQDGTVNFGQSHVQTRIANFGGHIALKVLLQSSDYAADAAVSLRVMSWVNAASTATISGAAGESMMRAYAI
jgi:hypothetical protein